MPRKGWKYVPIREDIYKFMQDVVARYPALGYSTITELVRDAIRQRLMEVLEQLRLDVRKAKITHEADQAADDVKP